LDLIAAYEHVYQLLLASWHQQVLLLVLLQILQMLQTPPWLLLPPAQLEQSFAQVHMSQGPMAA
jgi:hypothetical protein